MKSVIVQGATIAKAIDEALSKAGMPKEFFVKVLEEAQSGFLGFGAKKAKIALFFKKEDKKPDGSLLSRGTYKNLFDNEAIQSQLREDAQSEFSRDAYEEEQKKTPVMHQKNSHNNGKSTGNARENKSDCRTVGEKSFSAKESQPPHRKEQPPHASQQQRAQQPHSKHEKLHPVHEQKQHPVKQQNPKIASSNAVQPLQKKLLIQRPLKSLIVHQKQQDQKVSQALKDNGLDGQLAKNKPLETLQHDNDSQNSQPVKKRARRRRHYGYRSKAPVQWGKSQDESSFDQLSDERHDSGSE